jgi:AbrB family looped-hinge helix DNA binding protein
MPSAMVTFNGRITLPLHVRKELGLKTGDTVEFVEVEKGRFSILPGPQCISGGRDLGSLGRTPASEEEEMDELVQ